MKEILDMKLVHERMVKRRLLKAQKLAEEAAGITSSTPNKPDPYSTTKKKKLKPATKY